MGLAVAVGVLVGLAVAVGLDVPSALFNEIAALSVCTKFSSL